MAIPPSGAPTTNPPIYDYNNTGTGPFWIRYSNGVIDMWGTVASGTMSTASGSLFVPAANPTVTFPIPLQTTAYAEISTALVSTTPGSSGVTAFTVNGMTLTPFASVTAATGTVQWRVIGTWF